MCFAEVRQKVVKMNLLCRWEDDVQLIHVRCLCTCEIKLTLGQKNDVLVNSTYNISSLHHNNLLTCG